MENFNLNTLKRVPLHKTLESPFGFHALSLIYRSNNDYKNEKKILDSAAKIFDKYDYFKERIFWHNQPLSKKTRVRKNTLEVTPYQCKDFVFVTGADSNYYEMLVGLIESIRSTKNYRTTTIGVLDCGLTDEQKKYIVCNFENIIFKDPGWDVPDLEGIYLNQKLNPLTDAFKGMIARPFINKHFPGFRYYLWIDSDAWINDENVIARYIELAKKTGLATSKALCEKYENHISSKVTPSPILTEYDLDLKRENALCLINGGFCIDAEKPFFERWQNIFTTSIKNHCFHFYTDYVTFTYLIHSLNIKEFLPFEDHFYFTSNPSSGNPIIRDDPDLLFCPLSNKPIGILHLTQIKNRGYDLMQFPTQKITDVLNGERLQEHLKISQLSWLAPYEINFPNHVNTSFAFRIYNNESDAQLKWEIEEKLQCLNS